MLHLQMYKKYVSLYRHWYKSENLILRISVILVELMNAVTHHPIEDYSV